MTVLALITARGGSKGLPRKNVLPLGGKPLIAWTIAAAKAARSINRLVWCGYRGRRPKNLFHSRELSCEWLSILTCARATRCA